MIPILKKNEPWPVHKPAEGSVVLVNKPVDWTSFDVVNKIRRALKIKKVGHAGTLDPFAVGLLLIGLERATKQLGQLSGLDKRYRAVIRLGVETDSYDRTGQVLKTSDPSTVSESVVRAAVNDMQGELWQTPPMFSAKKVNGKPLYKLARKGKVIEREARKVWIHHAQILRWAPPLLELDLLVSKGTYVRSYAHDLGQKLQVGAMLEELERTEIGPYRLTDSFAVDQFIDFWLERYGVNHADH